MSDEKRSEDELDEKADAADDTAKEKDAASTEAGDADVVVAERAEGRDEDAGELEDADPAAIARRVAMLGADDATDALASEEERKLAERRAQKKGGKRKGGLEVAASKKLSQIGKRAEPKRRVAVAADADPLIERTVKLSEWAKKNQKLVQIVGVALCVGLLSLAGYLWYDKNRELEASTILAKAVETQRASIGEPRKADEEVEDETQLHFKTFEDRREAALKQYRDVQSRFSGTGAAILARLAEGSLLLDNREPDKAIEAFEDVKRSPLAAADVEVRGRALEGVGFAHELAAVAAPDNKDKHLDAALEAFKELENTADVKGFKELAMYHQARVWIGKGDKDKAKELLVSVKERVNKFEDPPAMGLPSSPSFPYLKEVAMDRLHEIDPEAAPKSNMQPGGGAMNLTPAQIKKMIEDMQKKGGAPHGDEH